MNEIWIWVGLALAGVAGFALGFALATVRSRGGPGSGTGSALPERLAAAQATAQRLAEENAQLREQARRDNDVLRALAPVRDKLSDVAAHVTALEQERTRQYAALNEQLAASRRTDEQLAEQARSLREALRTTTRRGAWGEIQLRRVLELAGLARYVDFAEQVTIRSADAAGRRPDAVVQLPGNARIAIDAKTPMDAFLRAGTPDLDPALVAQGKAAHAKAVRAHVDTLVARDYTHGLGNSLGFTIMFLPLESLLADALETDPTLLEYALSKGITPATPSSLLALLKTVALMWQHATVHDQAMDLLELGRTLYKRLGILGAHVTKLGSSLQNAVRDYNKVVGSLESRVLATCRSFDLFEADQLLPPAVEPAAASVKPLTSPELTSPESGRPRFEIP